MKEKTRVKVFNFHLTCAYSLIPEDTWIIYLIWPACYVDARCTLHKLLGLTHERLSCYLDGIGRTETVIMI